jgi:NAD(P) transhydrogenase
MAEAYRIAAIDGVNKLRPKNGVLPKKENK